MEHCLESGSLQAMLTAWLQDDPKPHLLPRRRCIPDVTGAATPRVVHVDSATAPSLLLPLPAYARAANWGYWRLLQ